MVYSVIHHTATGTHVSEETINSWQYYHVVIDYKGKIYDRKKKPHFRNDNKYSYDIALVGNFEVIEPSDAQIESLKRVVKENIIGHSEINEYGLYNPSTGIWPTACPGKNLLPIVQQLTTPMQLIKEANKNEVYLVLGGKRHWVRDGIILSNLQVQHSELGVVDVVNDVDDYPYAGDIGLGTTDDPNN